MRYKVIHVKEVYEAIKNNTIENARGTYVEVDKLIAELQAIQSVIVTDVSPNSLDLTIDHINNYLSKGGEVFAPTLSAVAAVTNISRPTLNEWRNCGIIHIRKQGVRTVSEKSMMYPNVNGYSIVDLLDQLKTYKTLQNFTKIAKNVTK